VVNNENERINEKHDSWASCAGLGQQLCCLRKVIKDEPVKIYRTRNTR